MLKKNIAANYIGTAVMGIISVEALSLNVKVFGLGNWGIIAGFVVVINIMMMAELGISQIYVSEYNKTKDKATIFRQYFDAILLLGSVATLLIGVVSIVFGKGSTSTGPTVPWGSIVAVAMIVYFLTFVNNIFYIHLMAEQRQVELNVRQSIFLLAKNVCALVFATFVSKEPIAYFGAFALVGGIEFVVNISKSSLKFDISRFSLAETIRLLSGVKGLSFAIAIGILGFNYDRLFLSRTMNSADFGIYAVTVTVGLYFMQLQYPLVKAFFPHLASAMLQGERGDSRRLFAIQLISSSIIVVPPLLVGGLYARSILHYFSLDASINSEAISLFRCIIVYVYLNTVYNIFYQRMMILNASNAIIAINAIMTLASIALLGACGLERPFFAGALCWIVASSIQLFGAITFAVVTRRST